MQMLQIPNHPKVLVVGSGAREHAIAWALAQSPLRPQLFAAPGNPGIAELAACNSIAADDVGGLVEFTVSNAIDLVVVGPEVPLSGGIADRCREQGILVFGPVQAAARLESSKAFAKELMKAAGVPTAAYETFDDAEAAQAYIHSVGAPIVIKADGLAAGKGVVVAQTTAEALSAVDEMMVERKFGSSGGRVVVESMLEGPELSLMFFVDSDTVVPMIPARDHKRAFDGDAGPNTGGMGAFAPVPDVDTGALSDTVIRTIVRPLLHELRQRGITYRGVLYAGLMLTADGPQVIEFNARFGDPETEAVLPLLETDLLQLMWAVSVDRLADVPIQWKPAHAVCVVLSAAGYPGSPRKGDEITMPPRDEVAGTGNIAFHAGTKLAHGTLVTDGGRVLTAVGVGDDFKEARRSAYALASSIQFEGKHMRTDIGGNG